MILLYYRKTNSAYPRIFLFFLLFFSSGIYAQQDPAVLNLLNQRAGLIQSGESTSAVDFQLYALGHVPPAILHIEAQPQLVTASWDVYRSVSPERAAQVFTRLSSHYSNLLSIQPSSDGMSITALFKSGTTAAQIGEVSNHFGFQGYEEH